MNERTDDKLSLALRALADADAAQEAAPHVETALLQAFRQAGQPAVIQATAPQPARVLAFTARSAPRPTAWRYGLAAAAALLCLSFGWLGWRARPTDSAPKIYLANKPSPPSPSPTDTPALRDELVQTQIPQPVSFKATRKMAKAAQGIRRLQLAPSQTVEEEIATDFFPLVTQDALPARGQLRRVKVPRSTLIRFGLPVSAERLEIPINADLLVGEDGAARAIRFVQERIPPDSVIPDSVINVYGGNASRRPIPTSYRNPR